MKKINLLQDFFDSKSDANMFLEASQQEQLENDFQEWFDKKMKDFKFAATFLVKHIAENHNPHASAYVRSDSAELSYAENTFQDDGFIVD